MDPKELQKLKEAMGTAFDETLQAKLAPIVGSMVAEQVKSIVEDMRVQRALTGKDITGLSEKQKKDFVEIARAAAKVVGSIDTKANEALIEEQDNRGGYLVSREVADAILRIAASVGTIMSQTQKWPMTTDELGIPNFTGSFLTGSYLGVDVAGTVQGLTFGQALLIAKKWQLAFVVGNDLLSDASVNLAEWLLALAGEGLANMVDQQGFIGTGAPFVGVLNQPNTTLFTLATGKVSFDLFDVLGDASTMIGNLEESILDGAAFYMHRTVWASLRTQKDGNGNFILPFAGLAPGTLENIPGGGPIKPAGQILGYPVFTNRWLPTLAQSAISTSFMIFGNMKSMAWGDRGEMRVSQFESGSFGGKEVALADQKGIVYKHRHALVTALPAAFVIAKTSAS